MNIETRCNTWTEKYRPTDLDLIEHVPEYIRYCVDLPRLSSMIFCGPPGCGKTTCANALMTKHFQQIRDRWSPRKRYLWLNTKIPTMDQTEYIKDCILPYCEHSLTNQPFRQAVVVEEADLLGFSDQIYLLSIIDRFMDRIAFVILCNHESKIIADIVGKCVNIRFLPIEAKVMKNIITNIISDENMDLKFIEDLDNFVEEIIIHSMGDARRAIHFLQQYTNDKLMKTFNDDCIYSLIQRFNMSTTTATEDMVATQPPIQPSIEVCMSVLKCHFLETGCDISVWIDRVAGIFIKKIVMENKKNIPESEIEKCFDIMDDILIFIESCRATYHSDILLIHITLLLMKIANICNNNNKNP
jgi:DNA polymerase III delta prime subunit